MQFTTVQSVEAYLNEIPKFQSTGKKAAKFDLLRFKTFCKEIGHPQEQFSAVHIGGTNGKGSTCFQLASVLQQAGYKTGIYTSPHVINYRERFRIDDHYITDEDLVQFFNTHIDRIEEFRLTYFEISTAVAFWWFAHSHVDIACIEVGLGGRLDATNIISPITSVISSIALDHTEILGDTIEEIAREKAGIIKEGIPVVVGDLPPDAFRVIADIADQNDSALYTIESLDPTFVHPGHYRLFIEEKSLEIKSPLTAPVQAKNMALVWQVCQVIKKRFSVTKKAFVDGLKHVNVGLGRFEKLVEGQEWYFDGGHNLEAIQALKQSVAGVGDYQDATLVLSLMKDKIRLPMMEEFLEFKNIYYYALNLERAATFDDINKWLPKANPFPVTKEDREKLLQDDFESELVIFSGSFYFYETVRGWVSTFVLNQ